MTVTVGRCRKPPSDLRKRALVTVGRRWRSPVSAGLPADYLRTAGPSDTLCIRSEGMAIAATFSVEELRACVGRSVPSLGPLHMLSREPRRAPRAGVRTVASGACRLGAVRPGQSWLCLPSCGAPATPVHRVCSGGGGSVSRAADLDEGIECVRGVVLPLLSATAQQRRAAAVVAVRRRSSVGSRD